MMTPFFKFEGPPLPRPDCLHLGYFYPIQRKVAQDFSDAVYIFLFFKRDVVEYLKEQGIEIPIEIPVFLETTKITDFITYIDDMMENGDAGDLEVMDDIVSTVSVDKLLYQVRNR